MKSLFKIGVQWIGDHEFTIVVKNLKIKRSWENAKVLMKYFYVEIWEQPLIYNRNIYNVLEIGDIELQFYQIKNKFKMKMNKFQKEKGGKRLIDLRKNFNPNVLFALNVSSLLKWSFTNPNQKQ